MLVSWGANKVGQLAHGDTARRPAPRLVKPRAALAAGSLVSVSLGASHALALLESAHQIDEFKALLRPRCGLLASVLVPAERREEFVASERRGSLHPNPNDGSTPTAGNTTDPRAARPGVPAVATPHQHHVPVCRRDGGWAGSV